MLAKEWAKGKFKMETIPKAPKSIANGQKKNVFQKILGSVLVLADYNNEKN